MSADAKKVVVRLDVHDDKAKKKAMGKVSSLLGIDSLTMDMEEKKLTVIGAVDPVDVVQKLKKCYHAQILTVGPAKEEKKVEPEKDGGDKDKDEQTKAIEDYHHHASVYIVQSAEENPNACPLC